MSARRNGSIGRTAILAGLAAAALVAAANAKPVRVVSLNLCTDQLVVDLLPRQRIAAVTELATDALSTPVPERARGIPVTLATAEDVIARRADLVMASPFSDPSTLDLLRRTGHKVETTGAAQTVAGVKEAIRKAAATLGTEARGDALVAEIDVAIARNRPEGATRPTAVVLQPNNFVSDRDGLMSELLELAGLRPHPVHAAAGRADVETLVVAPPDVLILSSAPGDYAAVAADNLRHPALAQLMARVPTAVVPWSGWLCGTHHIARVLDDLGALRRRALAGGSRG